MPYRLGVKTLELVNPAQMDVLAGGLSDRKLVVEVWFPAAANTVPGGIYVTFCRDGLTSVTLHGQASRDAGAADGDFPLVILSHGYPGNRIVARQTE